MNSSAATAEPGAASTSEGDVETPSLEKLKPVVVFSIEACRFCREAESVLKEAGIGFSELTVSVGSANAALIRSQLAAVSGIRTVPVVYAAGHLIGGSQETKEAIDSGKLASLLEGPPKAYSRDMQTLLHTCLQPPLAAPQGATLLSPSSSTSGPSWWGGVPQAELHQLLAVYKKMVDPVGGVPRVDKREGGSLPFLPGHVERNVFSGAAAVSWLLANGIPDRPSAIGVCQGLERLGLLHHFRCSFPFSDHPNVFFRLLADEAAASPALNAQAPWLRPSRPAQLVAQELRAFTLAMYDEALSLDGRSVDYGRIATSPSFSKYQEAAQELQKVEVLSMSRQEQKAFWLNVYNSLIIHGLVARGPPTNLLQRLGYYDTVMYRVGGLDFSLNDIENGVLRANRGGAAPGSKPPFRGGDERRYYTLPPVDPRVHFALNCGAKSCPPIKLFSGASLEEELDSATAAFLSEDVEVKVEERVVELSKLVQWYGEDFGETDRQRLMWVKRFLPEQKQHQLDKLLQGEGEGKAPVKLKFKPYNWSLNDE